MKRKRAKERKSVRWYDFHCISFLFCFFIPIVFGMFFSLDCYIHTQTHDAATDLSSRCSRSCFTKIGISSEETVVVAAAVAFPSDIIFFFFWLNEISSCVCVKEDYIPHGSGIFPSLYIPPTLWNEIKSSLTRSFLIVFCRLTISFLSTQRPRYIESRSNGLTLL